ncbi:peroxidase family protein [Azospirillum sp. sgz302134]
MEFRTIDGSKNSRSEPGLNTPGSALARSMDARFDDGVSVPVDGPNPRMISNMVVGQGDAAVANREGLSGMMYAWGQFIDHDLDLMASDGKTKFGVTVPKGDPDLPSGSTIAMTRAVTAKGTGTGPDNPATATNTVTGWEDASMVYGSDAKTADSLRLSDGRMKTSAGGNLPIVGGAYAAGDVRAAENASLTSLQTLFVREHNHQVERLRKDDPKLSGDQLYDRARAIVTAEIEHVTHDEFLPHLLGPNALSAYKGYDPTADPRISVEFAGAAYRFGHSMVSAETERLGNDGEVDGPALELRDAFFMDPKSFAADSGADGFLRHLGSDLSQAMDARIVDDLRNFLFDPPVAQDLAAINIQRGRDLGLPTLNQARAALGLKPYTSFDQITNDKATAAALKDAFGIVDSVDLWTGGISENHVSGGVVGPTFAAIIADQFEALRDGDRLWYQNQGFDAETLKAIQGTTLADIIERNTDTTYLQNDVFTYFDRHKAGTESEHPDAPQLLVGTDGSDDLVGGPAGDAILAGRDQQTMTGKGGRDLFVFTAPNQDATITDFRPGQDSVEFHDGRGLRFDDVTVSEKNGTAVVQAGGHRIEMPGVRADQLTRGSYFFDD